MNPFGAGALAAAIAWLAQRLRWLSPSGAVAATIVGAIVLAAGGFAAGVLLAVFFVTSSALTKLQRQRRPYAHEANDGGRTARQVLANGAWVAIGAALIPLSDSGWPLLTGALAAAQADTWSTEVGAFSTAPPRLITTWVAVSPGTSGGVTTLGTIAGVVGAAVMAGAAFLAGTGTTVAVAAFGGGIVGTVIDSFFGATVQGHYICERCQVTTERARHECGEPGKRLRGVTWIDNDVVNFMTTASGGAVAVGVTHLL